MQAISNAVDAVRERVVTKPTEPDDWLKADQVEEVADDEDEKIDQIGKLVHGMMQHNFDSHQHWFRGTHVKTLAIVRGSLTINPSLPQHLQHGIFIPGTTYPAIARYANEPSFIQPDHANAPRGLGLKLFNIPPAAGERLTPDDGLTTQDFLFNNSPSVELTDIQTTLEIFQLRAKYFDDPTRLQLELAKRSDRLKQFAPGLLPNEYVIAATLFTQSCFAYGPYVAHISLLPTSPAQTPLQGQTIPSSASPTYHRDHLHTYYSTHHATYTLRAQFCSNLSSHPVEDASAVWDDVTAPWHDLATLEFPPQETLSEERRIWWEDHIALSPWDGVAAHKPLGGINRLRKRVYEMGRKRRAEGNSVKEGIKLPAEVGEMPE